jgi:hypothetical protein
MFVIRGKGKGGGGPKFKEIAARNLTLSLLSFGALKLLHDYLNKQ